MNNDGVYENVEIGEYLSMLCGVAAFRSHGLLPRRSGIAAARCPRQDVAELRAITSPSSGQSQATQRRSLAVARSGALPLISMVDCDRGVQPDRRRGRSSDRWGVGKAKGSLRGARSDSWRHPHRQTSPAATAPPGTRSGDLRATGEHRCQAGDPPSAGRADDPALWCPSCPSRAGRLWHINMH